MKKPSSKTGGIAIGVEPVKSKIFSGKGAAFRWNAPGGESIKFEPVDHYQLLSTGVRCKDCGEVRGVHTPISADTFVCRYCLGTNGEVPTSPQEESFELKREPENDWWEKPKEPEQGDSSTYTAAGIKDTILSIPGTEAVYLVECAPELDIKVVVEHEHNNPTTKKLIMSFVEQIRPAAMVFNVYLQCKCCDY